MEMLACRPGGGGRLEIKWSSQLVQNCVWKGGSEKAKLCGSVYTQKGGLNPTIS